MPLQTQEKPFRVEVKLNTLERNFIISGINIPEKTQIPDRILDARKEVINFVNADNNYGQFQKPHILEILGTAVAMAGAMYFVMLPSNIDQGNNIEQNPTTIQNIQNLRSNYSNTVRQF
jgi:hypothetical protein